MAAPVSERIAGTYADGWSRIVATMIRFTGGNWDLAEECAQDASATAAAPVLTFPAASAGWPTAGGSASPGQPAPRSASGAASAGSPARSGAPRRR
jgi:predicted RNA polymerase sigma factor